MFRYGCFPAYWSRYAPQTQVIANSDSIDVASHQIIYLTAGDNPHSSIHEMTTVLLFLSAPQAGRASQAGRDLTRSRLPNYKFPGCLTGKDFSITSRRLGSNVKYIATLFAYQKIE
ncbi:hypothetical protein BD309DRAFT_393722 [Dichomitus squalens]|uniref:Uncharacterized protein n=1 Tax=Dichomitus squalens TaxID=114155 RepID=A0A4Q9Q6V3_9APHY|nr:hypothetical protein BD309DRAFT_393722 [Dichomitus squalens]TBU62691.1 hypothetical protein BD310DRAFT_698574 [Dichomitus squalens]